LLYIYKATIFLKNNKLTTSFARPKEVVKKRALFEKFRPNIDSGSLKPQKFFVEVFPRFAGNAYRSSCLVSRSFSERFSMEIELTDKIFKKEVLESKIPVLVDFWAEWCPPCKMMLSVVDEIAREFEGKIKVGKINVDANQELAGKYSVMSIPTFIIFKDGKNVSRFMGAQPKERVVEEIKRALKNEKGKMKK